MCATVVNVCHKPGCIQSMKNMENRQEKPMTMGIKEVVEAFDFAGTIWAFTTESVPLFGTVDGWLLD